ncbi:MAG: SH3 domain-containing protein, partial [Anaerolineae bacterium]|nr:SH3 domain-containing protein [Anaerolineae bacterium]
QPGAEVARVAATAAPPTAMSAPLPAAPVPTATPQPTATPAPTATSLPTATSAPTATPLPTATPAPTATLAPTATEAPPRVKVTSDQLNIRSGPGTAYPVVGRLQRDDEAKVIGKSEDGKWWQIEVKEGKGWVSGEFVAPSGPVAGLPVVKAPPPPTAPPAVAAAAAAAGSAPPPSGGGYFGYGIQFDPAGDRGAAIAAVKGMGFNWVKFQLPWKDFEGAGPGQRNWPDDVIQDLHANGLNVLVSIVKAPAWARPANTDRSVEGPPADPGTYASFVGEFAARYCGRVQAIEVWNEQNLDYEWGREPLDPARYVRLLAAAYGAIKRACGSIVVVSGALTPTGAPEPAALDDFVYLERMYQAGLRNYADAIGAHPSGYNVAPDIPGGAPACDFIRSQGSLFRGPCDSPHHSWSFRSTMEGYRNIMVRYGDAGKRIWPTEFGWASGWTGHRGYEYAQDNTLDEQAQWTVRAYQLMRSWGFVGPAFLWNLNYNVTQPGSEMAQWGIMGRPAYAALQAMGK